MHESVLEIGLSLDERCALVSESLLRRRADIVLHGHSTLYQHLIATFTILEAWGMSEEVCLAGLVHSAYSTDRFRTRLFTHGERAVVEQMVGTEAEKLAFLFSQVQRDDLFRKLEITDVSSNAKIETKTRSGKSIQLTRCDGASLLCIYMANEAEQRTASDGSPRPWLSRVSEWGRLLRMLSVSSPPPIFDHCTSLVTADDEGLLLNAYCAAVSASKKTYTPRFSALADASQRAPWTAEPMIWLGMVALAHGRAPEAAMYGRRASRLIHQWASPWDKSLSTTQWLSLATFLIDCGALVGENLSSFSRRINALLKGSGYRPERWYGRLSSADLLTTPEADRPDSAESSPRNAIKADSKRRLERYIAGLSFDNNIDSMQWYPSLPAQPWYEPSDFSLTRNLEMHSSEIIKEICMLDHSRYHREGEPIERTGDWDVMLLFERGKRNEENCSLLPKTSAIIESCRSLKSLSGLAYVSRLAPRTRVEPHRGPTNLRLRCHLGINIPDACGIRVEHYSRTWSEGKCLVFDDSFEHEVWNDSDHERIVLIVDIWHPDLSESEITVIEGLQRYIQAQSRKLFNYWKMNETTRIREEVFMNTASSVHERRPIDAS